MQRKKITGTAVCILSMIAVVYLISGFRRPVSYSDCVVSESQAEEIMTGRKETGNLLDALVFNEETLFFDAANQMFYYSLIENDAKAYHPNVEVKSEEADLEIAFLTEEITQEEIRNNRTITVLAYTEDAYCKYGLKCTTLPLMNIDCAGEILDDSMPMQVTLFDNSERTAKRIIVSDGEIRARGATTKAFLKKGYRFSLKLESLGGNIRPNHVSLLGMRQDDDWLLYAAYNDQEKIRNVFSMNLWAYTCAFDNAQGINTGMEYRYIELFLNGEYWGLYALGYPIDEKQVGIEKESMEAALYKHGIRSEKLEFTRNGDIVTSGAYSDDRESVLHTYYYDLYLNADDNDKLYSGIDIDNAVDFYLFINLIQGVDNVDLIKNFYILAQKEADGIRALYVPWDLDLAWSNHYIGVLSSNCTYPYAHTEDYNCIIKSGYISQLLVNGDERIWEAVFEKYRNLRKGGWSEESINALLDEYEADVYGSGAYLREKERWPDGTYTEEENGLAAFREYVMRRLQEADLYYERLEEIYHKTENVYLRRSAEYKNFLGRNFLIEINDKNLLNDSDYKEFLEYIGVDTAVVTEDVRFILANPEENRYEYLSSLGEEEGRETCIGRMSFSRLREGVYEVKINGVECYTTSIFLKPAAEMMVLEKDMGEICAFNFEKGYDMPKKEAALADLELYMDALASTDYYAVIEINDRSICQDGVYRSLFEKFGISADNIHDTTDFIVWNGREKTAFAVDDFHSSGGSMETEAASFAVYWNDTGEYGVYYDGAECFVSSEAQNEYVDIRIVLLDPESYDVVDSLIYR